MAICVSHGGQTVSQAARPSDAVLVATTDGVASLQRSAPGASWEASRSLQGKHVSALMIEPARGVVFAGTHGDGIYASEDGGQTWERRDAGVEFGNIYALSFVESADGTRLYAGTEPAHLYVSAIAAAAGRSYPPFAPFQASRNGRSPGPRTRPTSST